jgi:hypothetical protein
MLRVELPVVLLSPSRRVVPRVINHAWLIVVLYGLKWYRGLDHASLDLRTAHASFARETSQNGSKYLKVTATPFSHSPKTDITSLIIYIPVWLHSFRNFLRKQFHHATVKPTATDLTNSVMCQPLLRHGVHVHGGSGGCGSSVNLYRLKKFITFSSDNSSTHDVTIFVKDHQPYHSLTDKHKVIRELMEVINVRIELVKFIQVGRRITKGFDKGCRCSVGRKPWAYRFLGSGCSSASGFALSRRSSPSCVA